MLVLAWDPDWGVFWSLFILFFIFIPLIYLWGFALMDLFRRRDVSGWAKVAWLLLILIIPVFGALIYVLVRGVPEETSYTK
jgi:hypothetical protein